MAGAMISGVIFLGFWIAYGVVAGLSAEFQASANLYTYDSYRQYESEIREVVPGVTISATSTGNSEWICTLDSWSVSGVSANDSSEFAAIARKDGRVRRVSSTLSVEWTAESQHRIYEAVNDLSDRMRDIDSYGMIWTVNYADECPGFKAHMIVSGDGNLPTQFNKGRGIAAAFFWSGIVHAFEVDAVPVVRGAVVKRNAVIGELPAAESFGFPVCSMQQSNTDEDDDDYYYNARR
jgi:hypothetical protein